MVSSDSKAVAEGQQPSERQPGVVREISQARADRQAPKAKDYLDVSWPDPPYAISEGGYRLFKEEVEVYIRNLMNAARAVAREADLDSISPIHIRKALKLFSNKPQTRRSKLFEISGGLLAGASLSLILSGTLVDSGVIYQTLVCTAGFLGALFIGISLKGQ